MAVLWKQRENLITLELNLASKGQGEFFSAPFSSTRPETLRLVFFFFLSLLLFNLETDMDLECLWSP